MAVPRERTRRRFRAAEDGLGLVEFGLVAPVIVVLYFGLVAVSGALALDRKVSLVDRTVADLLGRATASMDCANFKDRVGAASAVLAPFDPTGLTVSVASVSVDNAGVAKVLWSQARRIAGTAGEQASATVPTEWAAGSTITPPTGFAVNNSTFFLSRVEKDYRPVVGQGLIGTVHLKRGMSWPIRNSQPVTWTGTTTCP